MKYYSAFKMNEIPKQATRLNTLYEMNQIQKLLYNFRHEIYRVIKL